MLNRKSNNEVYYDWERIDIIDACTEKEKQAIYRFRYKVLVDEMRRKIPGVDYHGKRMFDSLDPWSVLIYAKCGPTIVGTARVTIGAASDFPREMSNVLRLACFQEFAPGASNLLLATKLAVLPKFRSTSVSFRIMNRCYEIAREREVQFGVTGCNPYLIPMYELLGYRQYTAGFQDPGFGFVVPTMCLGEDVEHLIAVRSPFSRIARKFPNSLAAKHWLLANYPQFYQYPIGIQTSEDERWSYIEGLIGDPSGTISVLKGIGEDEAKKLLQVGTLVECSSRNRFFRKGDVCNELNILIAGEMTVTDANGRVSQARPGNAIGAVGLFGQTHHDIDAVAVGDCEILAIGRPSFEKLRHSRPQLADKLRVLELRKEGR